MKSQAVLFSDVGRVHIGEVDVPDQPGPGQVLIQNVANGICQGEVHLYKGIIPPHHPYPFIGGHEPVGYVVAVGEGVDDLAPGEAVTSLWEGVWSQYFITQREQVAPLPLGADSLKYWIAEPVTCATNALRLLNVQPADRVTVIGCGFMGLLLIQGLRYTLAAEVQVYDINPQRMELAEGFGAKACSVRDLEKERDIVVEASGAAEALALSETLVRNGGTLALYSWHIPTRTVDTSRWHVAGYTVLNTSPLASRDFLADFRAAVTLMGKGVFDLKPLITHEYPFTEAPQVLELLSVNRPPDYIKGVLIFEFEEGLGVH